MITITDAFKITYPDAFAGILVMRNVVNPSNHAGLEARKEALENDIRTRFEGGDRSTIRAIDAMKAYSDYYKRFRKTYHVQLQLESVAFKGRSLPSVASLVECMFMAELKNFLLTAVHDLDTIQRPINLDVANGSETYTMLNGRDEELKEGDMFFADAEGIMSSIVYGPDRRTQVTPDTRNVLFTVYAVPGITRDEVHQHFDYIHDNVLLIAPEATVEVIGIHGLQPNGH